MPTLTAGPDFVAAFADRATSGAACEVKTNVEEKKRIEELLGLTTMSLYAVNDDAMRNFINRGQQLYMSFTDKLESLREVRDTARAECKDRSHDIDAFIRKLCQDDFGSLAQAVSDTNVKQVHGYLDLGVSPAADPSGNEENSLLEAAIKKGDEQIAQILLPYSSNRNLLDSLNVLLSMAAKEHAWNRFVPMARSLALHLNSWVLTEEQITKWLDRNPEKLDAEALSRAKGFHQATFAHLKARKAVNESKAHEESRKYQICNPPGIVKTLAYAVSERNYWLVELYQALGVRLTETTLVDTPSPLDIAVEMGDEEVFQSLLPYSDERIAIDALILILEKVIASPDWHKWVPWGRQVIDHMADWKTAKAQFEKLITRMINDSRKPLSDNAQARAIAFHDEVLAYFQSPTFSYIASTDVRPASDTAINAARANSNRADSSISAQQEESALLKAAKYGRVGSVNLVLKRAFHQEKLDALVTVACEIHFAEANQLLSYEDLRRRKLVDPLDDGTDAHIEKCEDEISKLKGGNDDSQAKLFDLTEKIKGYRTKLELQKAKIKQQDSEKLDRLRTVARNILNSFPQGASREAALIYVREHAGVFARHIETLLDQPENRSDARG